jgi:hypothetical protein
VVCLESENESGRVKCAKCSFGNLANAHFCSGCGAGLKPLPAEAKGRFEALSLLLLVGSAYLIVSLAADMVYQVVVFAIVSIVSVVFGVYAGYELYRGRFGRGVLASSVVAVTFGFAITFLIFWIGLDVNGVFGPGWVIFAVAAWKLWNDKKAASWHERVS